MSSGESYPTGDPRDAGLSRRALLAGLGASAAAVFLLEGCGEQKGPKFGNKPDWEQDFAKMPDGAVDPTIWSVRQGNNNGWGNKQQETYTDHAQNIRIQDGALILQADRQHIDHAAPYTSARIDTQGKRSFGYGKMEIVGRVPYGTGTWPAFWMLSDTQKYQLEQVGLKKDAPNKWILNGEIDIMEAVGSRPGIIYPAIHTYDSVDRGVVLNPRPQIAAADDTKKFHTYGVEHTPERMIFTFDGNPYYQVTKAETVPAGTPTAEVPRYWPFDQNYYLIVNLAMGGTWGGEKHDAYPPYGVDDTTGPWQLRVKSIRHYPFISEKS